MNTQFKKGILEMCVLALVSQKDIYGYELLEAISKEIEIAEGTVYPILRRLTTEGFFETYLKESNEGPPRKYYRSTPKGQLAAQEVIREWQTFNLSVNRLIKKSIKGQAS